MHWKSLESSNSSSTLFSHSCGNHRGQRRRNLQPCWNSGSKGSFPSFIECALIRENFSIVEFSFRGVKSKIVVALESKSCRDQPHPAFDGKSGSRGAKEVGAYDIVNEILSNPDSIFLGSDLHFNPIRNKLLDLEAILADDLFSNQEFERVMASARIDWDRKSKCCRSPFIHIKFHRPTFI